MKCCECQKDTKTALAVRSGLRNLYLCMDCLPGETGAAVLVHMALKCKASLQDEAAVEYMREVLDTHPELQPAWYGPLKDLVARYTG